MSDLITVENNESSSVVAVEPHMRLIEMAVSKGADIVQLERLMDLQERYEANQSKKMFNEAMSAFQSSLPVIEKLGVVNYTSTKGQTFYTYAKLEDIANSIRPALKETGLSYRFTQSQTGQLITVKCVVTHKAGHSEESELSAAPDSSGGKEALKAIASSISYLRRYTLTGILGIVVGGEDDDAGGMTSEEIKKIAPVQDCYPDSEFNKNFSKWSQMIMDGKKTVDELHAFLTGKNIILSNNQYNKLNQVGKA